MESVFLKDMFVQLTLGARECHGKNGAGEIFIERIMFLSTKLFYRETALEVASACQV